MNIDISKIKIPANYVLVKVDHDHETYHNSQTGENTGIDVAPWGINQATHLAVTGTVVTIPEKLNYRGKKINELKANKDRSPDDQKEVSRLRNASVAYDVDIELKVGWKVMFEYLTKINCFKEGRAIENADGKFILIPYDQLILIFKPTTDFDNVGVGDVYPLNGFLLIKPLEYATEKDAAGIKGMKTEMDIFIPQQQDAKYVRQDNLWYANILAAGCYVRDYIDFPGAGSDGRLQGKPGEKICYNGKMQRKLEQDHHRVIFKKHTLYRIHRKDIYAVFTDGNISAKAKKK